MAENTDNDSIKQIPIRDLKPEPEAEDLLGSAAMEPYMNLFREAGPVLQRPEVPFRIRVVIGDMRPAVRLRHPEIRH